MNLDEILVKIQEDQNRDIVGIPLQFGRYKEVFDNIEQGDSIIVLGGSGTGKTSFTIDKFLIDPLIYSFNNPDKIKLHIDYFNLEESQHRFDLKLLSNISYKFLKKEYSVKDFQNRNGKKLLLNNTEQFRTLNPFINFFNSSVKIYEDQTPLLIKKSIIQSSKMLEQKEWDFNSKNNYRIVIIDNLKFLKSDNSDKKKLVIDELCLNIMQKFRKEQNVIPIIIQHTSVSNDNVVVNVRGDVIDNKLKPSLNNMGDSNDTQTPATSVIGLFSPKRFNIPIYPSKKGYDIDKLGKSFVSVIPLKSRDTEYENIDLPMHFKGNVSHFVEMERIEDFQKNPNLYLKYNPEFIENDKKININFKELINK